MKKTARRSFGDDYECKQDWPEECFLQCGDRGVVLGKKPYQTAFFEAFPKNPSTFIRGEGEDVEAAELAAFKKYERIIACKEHEYSRHVQSEHGVCKHCNLFTSNVFAPVHNCVDCGEEQVNFWDINSKYYCLKCFMNRHFSIMKDYDSLDKLKEYEGDDSDYEDNKMVLDFYEFIVLAQKYNIIDFSLPNYKLYHELYDKNENFDIFAANVFIKFYNELNSSLPEGKKFLVRGLMFNKFNDHRFMNRTLNESLFKSFFKIEEVDFEPLVREHFFSLYNRYKYEEKK